ncbi:hypothetical protein R0137_14920 [Congregibacter brevis]|uniref:Type II secretion system protein GspC N-terminal domain-containing protein n=1 Tax=Congregibacter brevis TaxID=3081201 RepID=A0ABZ0ICI0_9GAMM|nr:hypothetical protein R0137_14920 [Congregibacter sp. IMCC45268]
MNVLEMARSRYSVQVEPQRSERRLELIVLALILVIGLQVVWWFLAHTSNVQVKAVAPAGDSLRVMDARAPGSITAPQSLQLQARPIFWASRRPNANAVAQQPVAGSTGKAARRLEGLQVAGAVGAGDQGKAIVIYKDKLMRLGIGDRVAGWSLQSVSLDQVVFVSAGLRDVRRLTPMPVVAAQKAAPAQTKQAASDVVRAAPQAAKAAVPSNTAKTAQKNNKTESKLTLGG